MINIFKKTANGISTLDEGPTVELGDIRMGIPEDQDPAEYLSSLLAQHLPSGPTNYSAMSNPIKSIADALSSVMQANRSEDPRDGMEDPFASIKSDENTSQYNLGERERESAIQDDYSRGDTSAPKASPDRYSGEEGVPSRTGPEPDSNIRRLMMALGIGGGAAAGGAGAVAALKKKKSPIDKAKGMGSDALSKLRSLIGR